MATNLTNMQAVFSGVRPEIAGPIASLEIEDTPLGGGGFGENYVCRSIDGSAPPLPLVIKLYRDDGAGSLQHSCTMVPRLITALQALDVDRAQQGEPPLREVHALSAAPLFSFEALKGGQVVHGYAALRLDTRGYLPLDRFTDGNDATQRQYLSLPLSTRLSLAADLAEGLFLLQSIGFVHGDINAPNLFVNIAEGHLSLIDYDGGALVRNAGDRPYVAAKNDDWRAPELTAQIAAQQAVFPDARADSWALGVGIHHLIFLINPLFFLNDLAGTTLQRYLGANLWPHFTSGDPLGQPGIDAFYAWWRGEWANLMTPLQSAFDVFVNTGTLDPDARPGGDIWVRALTATAPPPVIVAFAAQPAVVATPGDVVTLSWQVEDAARVFLSGVGALPATGQVTVTIARDTLFVLTAHGGGSARAGAAYASLSVRTQTVAFPPSQGAHPQSTGGALPAFAPGFTTRSVPEFLATGFSLPRFPRLPRLSQLARLPRLRGGLPARFHL